MSPYRPTAKCSPSLQLQYNGASRTVRDVRADDFLTANLTLLSQNLVRGLELSLGIYNLFDARYDYPGSADNVQDVIEQNGRTAHGKLTYRF